MKNKIFIFLEKHLGAWLIKLLCLTCRIVRTNVPPIEMKKIFAFWHCNLITLAYCHRNEGEAVLVSSSKDGQLISGPLEALGFETVRGSSGNNGVSALKALLKIDNTIATALDGPRGPAKQCKPGFLFIAQKKQIPIVCIEMRFSSCWRLSSWDRLIIPKPFSRIEANYSEPIYLKTKEDCETKLSLIEEKMG